eukprot:scaffold4311_cov164-Alexandrium_tamarense.AAC.2
MAKVRCKQQTVHEIKLPMAMMLLVFIGLTDCRLSLRGHRKRYVDVIISHYGLCPIPTDSYLFGTVSLPAVARVTSLSRLQMIASALLDGNSQRTVLVIKSESDLYQTTSGKTVSINMVLNTTNQKSVPNAGSEHQILVPPTHAETFQTPRAEPT